MKTKGMFSKYSDEELEKINQEMCNELNSRPSIITKLFNKMVKK